MGRSADELLRLAQQVCPKVSPCCTISACIVADALDGVVCGYWCDTPFAPLVGNVEGGHDFAVVDDHIIDLWAHEYYGLPAVVPVAAAEAGGYGSPTRWDQTIKDAKLQREINVFLSNVQRILQSGAQHES